MPPKNQSEPFVAERLTNQKSRPATNRILELDALRAISCLCLLLFHFTWVYQEKYGFASPLGFAFPFGKYGVALFFMLSGFVNAMTLLKKREPGDFFSARCIRILPSYWLVICLNIWLIALVPMFQMVNSPDLALANLTTMPNLLGYENMEPVTWTLQVEMLFYLFLMVSLAWGLLDRPLATMMAAISLCFIATTGFNAFAVVYPDSVWNGRFQFVEQLFFIRNFPLFAMGILLNEIRSNRGNRWCLSAGILASAVVFHAIDLRDHNPVAMAMLFGLLTASCYGKVPLLRFKPLIFISTISYSLYLFHNNLGCLLMKQLENAGVPPLATVVLATGFAIGIGTAITFWFEQPISRYLNRHWLAMKNRRTGTFIVPNTTNRSLDISVRAPH